MMILKDMSGVEPLDISDYLNGRKLLKNRISKIGLEEEGAWVRFPKNETYANDASVFKNRTPAEKQKMKKMWIRYVGELVSRPMVPAKAGLWLKRCYPDMWNASCGLHLHMSFGNLTYYAELMRPEYQKTVIVGMGDWANQEGLGNDHPIWERLSGANEYCNHQFHAEAQAGTKRKDYDHFRPGNRYTTIAYRYTAHKTIECRLLPMLESPEMAARAIRRVIDITNACLVKVVKRNQAESEVIEGPSLAEGIIERDVEEI